MDGVDLMDPICGPYGFGLRLKDNRKTRVPAARLLNADQVQHVYC